MIGRAAVAYAVELVEWVFLDAVLRAELELGVVETEEEEVVFLRVQCEEAMLVGRGEQVVV